MEFGAGGLVVAAKLKNLSSQGAHQGLVSKQSQTLLITPSIDCGR